MNKPQDRIALLIDAENVSKKYVKLIMDELSEYGVVTHKRVYGDFTNGSVLSWKENLAQYAMTPVFQFNSTKGKNASDSAMIIDAKLFFQLPDLIFFRIFLRQQFVDLFRSQNLQRFFQTAVTVGTDGIPWKPHTAIPQTVDQMLCGNIAG